jgi:hypothetical protein
MVRTAGSRALELDPERVLADEGLLRLAREYESARA